MMSSRKNDRQITLWNLDGTLASPLPGLIDLHAAALLRDGQRGFRKADRYALVCQHCDSLHPGRTVVVGDTPLHLLAAQSHGLRVVAVATGWFPADALRAAGANLVIENLSAGSDLFPQFVERNRC